MTTRTESDRREAEVAEFVAYAQARADALPSATPRCAECRKPAAECPCRKFAEIAASGGLERVDATEFGVWAAGVCAAARAWAARHGYQAEANTNGVLARSAYVRFTKAQASS